MDLFSLTARGPRKRVELRFKGDSLSQDFQVSEDTPNPVPSTSASASSSRESFTNSTTYLSDSNNNRVSVLSLNKTRNRLPALTVQAKNASRHDLVEIIDDALEQVFDPFQASQQVGVFEPEEVVKPSCSESASSVGRKPTGFLKLQAVHSNEEVVASSSAKRARSKGRSGSKKRERFRIETVASSTHASANPAATMATSDFTPSSVSRPVASNSAPASDVEPLDDEPMNDTQETPDTSSGITAESNAAAFQAHRPYPEAHVSSDESVASASTVDEEEEESLGDAATVLEELEQFAKDFRDLRIKRGYTQGHVSKLLAAINPNVSQSTVSRFESLCLSFPNIISLKPFFEIFKDQLEKECLVNKPVMDPKRGIWFASLGDLEIPPAKRKRFKRTLISSEMTKTLEKCFIANPTPSIEEIEVMEEYCKLEYRVVQTWFANRRRFQKAMEKQKKG